MKNTYLWLSLKHTGGNVNVNLLSSPIWCMVWLWIKICSREESVLLWKGINLHDINICCGISTKSTWKPNNFIHWTVSFDQMTSSIVLLCSPYFIHYYLLSPHPPPFIEVSRDAIRGANVWYYRPPNRSITTSSCSSCINNRQKYICQGFWEG